MLQKTSIVSRYLLGLLYLLSGAAGLFNLIPPPTELPQDMMTFMNGMMAAKYFFPFLKITELVCGLFLIVRIAPALMLMILAPITIHIFLVHAYLTPGLENVVLPIVIILLHAFSAVNYWNIYKPLLTRNGYAS